MKITTLLLAVACLLAVCMARPANQEYDYEEETPAPKTATPARSNPLLRRNPLSGRAAKTTTTTTPAPKQEEEEVEEEAEYPDEEQADSITTTETTKKVRTGMVRPFRSNDDLLAALKRRREQASLGKSHAAKSNDSETDTVQDSTPAPKRGNLSSSNRRKFNSAPKAEESQVDSESAAPPNRSGRRFSSRT